MKHTPGPWHANEFPLGCITIEQIGANHLPVAAIKFDESAADADEQRANARLLAASPILLDFCHLVLGHATDATHPAVIEAAETIIGIVDQ